jgi:curved DNA-binding protein CbpA
VTDAFAEFGVERRPWLDPASLRARYHELAAVRHPDKCGGDPLPLARLNEARGILSSPALRLRHLLALDTTREMTAEKFAPDFGLFSEVGMLTKMAGKISGENHSASSPTATAEAASLENKISAALERINLQLESLEEKIRSLDAFWPDGNPNELNRIAEEFSYLKKWRDSLRAARTLLLGG